MRLRWPRFLPGYPALLLIPALVVGWASLLWAPDVSYHNYPSVYERGFPLVFETYEDSLDMTSYEYIIISETKYDEIITHWYEQVSEFSVSHLLVDLIVALAAAYILAMGVDRLLFPAIRAVRRWKRGTGATG